MGVKISNLPAIVAPALTDVFPVVQSGITYKETFTQLSSLLSTIGVTTITGTANQVVASASTGPVILSLPQSIATTSDVTFGSVTFNPTTKGIVGTTTNNNAAAGYVGEYLSSTVLVGSEVALLLGVSSDITSIALTAGDWDVWGTVVINADVTTLVTTISAWINTVSATAPTLPASGARFLGNVDYSVGATQSVPVGQFRVSAPGALTVYLSCQAIFSVSTCGAYGFIGARRVR